MLEMKIAKLEDSLANSRILDESMIDVSRVQILNRVKIKNKASNSIMEYLIVSESEADIKKRKISVNTPIAKGLPWQGRWVKKWRSLFHREKLPLR
jgi:transcription elongation factor GreA